MTEYRMLQEQEINRTLFQHFIRRQVVDQCFRRENGSWVIKPDPFIDDWTEEDYQTLIRCLKHTVRSGGFVCGAFLSGALKGFVSVEHGLFGGGNRYLDLSSLHVSEDLRRNGIGKALFYAACEWARGQGAQKLYISAHSALESQAFYRSLGCTDAAEYNQKHVEAEPYDCQMEYRLFEVRRKKHMKKVILGSFIFLAGILSAAFILAGSLANDLMINGQHSSIWIISQYGLMPALAVFLCMAIAGLVLAIWGLFNQDDKNNF